jgi:hypothetical protein
MLPIENVKELISENPIKQVWKLLHYFHDSGYAGKVIKRIHNISEGEQEKNVEKQAIQIACCLKQAEEYFNASTIVGLATKPTLIYYGIVNLSQALVLLTKDASYSFDVLRKRGRQYANHGLELAKSSKDIKAGPVQDFLGGVKCGLAKNEGGAIGQFASFYESLVPPAICIPQEVHDSGKATFIEKTIAHPSVNMLDISYLLDKEMDILSLLKGLPELYSDLFDVGIQPRLSRGNIRSSVIKTYKPDLSSEKNKLDVMREHLDFFIDALPAQDKDRLFAFYQSKIQNLKTEADFGRNMHLSLDLTIVRGGIQCLETLFYPDIVDSINGKKFYVLEPESYIAEPAVYFIVAYCLGMLARYYPDVWMKVIKEQSTVAELMDSFLSSAYRKFPNLILDQMTSIKHNVHL